MRFIIFSAFRFIQGILSLLLLCLRNAVNSIFCTPCKLFAATGSDLASSVNDAWAQSDIKKWDRSVSVARRINHGSALLGLALYALFVTLPTTIFQVISFIIFRLFSSSATTLHVSE
jgi:hypothetical protein